MSLLFRTVATASIVAALAHPVGARRQDPEQGSLCVLRHIKLADVRMQSPDVPPAAEKYSLRLDGGQWVPLSSQQLVLLKDIPLDGRHKVAIRGDDRPFVAFTFSFSAYHTSDLCLWQSDLYLTWILNRPQESFAACRCKDVQPALWRPSPK